MRCPTCKTGRLISKIVRERAGEVYRRRYCNECPAHHTTLERVVTLNAGARAERDINARREFNPSQWWNPDIASIDPEMRAAKKARKAA